jgi:hypothetical protein
MLLTSSRNSIAGAVTVLQPGQLKNWAFIPGPDSTVLSAPNRPDRLWSRLNLLFSGTQGSFTGEFSVREAEHLTGSSGEVKTGQSCTIEAFEKTPASWHMHLTALR